MKDHFIDDRAVAAKLDDEPLRSTMRNLRLAEAQAIAGW
jgi:hypothetical protein